MPVSDAFALGTRLVHEDTLTVACRKLAPHLADDIRHARQYVDGTRRILPLTRLSRHFNKDNAQLRYTLFDNITPAPQNPAETHDTRQGLQQAVDRHPAIGILRDICAHQNVHVEIIVHNLPGHGLHNPPQFWGAVLIRTHLPYTPPAPQPAPAPQPVPDDTHTTGLHAETTLTAPQAPLRR